MTTSSYLPDSTSGIWNALTYKINCDVSMSICKCNIKLFILHNELALNCPK